MEITIEIPDEIAQRLDQAWEVIVLLVDQTVPGSTVTETESQAQTPKRQTKIKALQNWFEKPKPASLDFDRDQAKWEYLKEKHNL